VPSPASPDLGLADLVDLAEEVNTNMTVLVKRLMETFEKELDEGEHKDLSSLQQAILMEDRFNDLLARCVVAISN
jgi:hypothetical protein